MSIKIVLLCAKQVRMNFSPKSVLLLHYERPGEGQTPVGKREREREREREKIKAGDSNPRPLLSFIRQCLSLVTFSKEHIIWFSTLNLRLAKSAVPIATLVTITFSETIYLFIEISHEHLC